MVLPSPNASTHLSSLIVGFGLLVAFSIMWTRRSERMRNRGSKRDNPSELPQASGSERTKFDIRQVSPSLFELHKPFGNPNLQILFFHGLNLEGYKDPHLSTWESADGSCIWPQKWLAECYPDAHILSICYDEIVKSSNDMFIVVENLVFDIISQNIGQVSNCPIIMVGHCLGGLVIKGLCSKAHHQSHLKKDEKAKLDKFLSNVRGIFFYSTPHHGSRISETLISVGENSLLAYFQTLSKATARLNQDFDDLCKCYTKWRARGLGASLPMESGPSQDVVIVPEAAARYGDQFIQISGTHSSICKPRSKLSTSFSALTSLVKDVLYNLEMEVPDDGIHKCYGLPKYQESVEKRANHAQKQLLNTSILGIVGMGGIGKTTIAKQLFNNISKDFEYTCFVDNVKETPKHDLRDCVLCLLHHEGRKVDVSAIKWDHLQNKKTFIVLDDVDKPTLLKDLQLPELEHFGTGSKFIITSRNHDIFSVYQKGAYKLYDVNFLQVDEAHKLFCLHAFNSEDIPSSYVTRNFSLRQDVDRVVEKCHGLPLTLEVMGCYLRDYNNEPAVWEQAMERLGMAKDISDDDNEGVWKSLRVSYDALSTEAQKMFIEAATYFFERPAHEARAAWGTAHKCSDLMWATLLRRSLVKTTIDPENEVEDIELVWVHEHLRDLAKSMTEADVILDPEEEHIGTLDFQNVNGVETVKNCLRLSYLVPADGRSHLDKDLNPRLGYDRDLVLHVGLLEKFQNLKFLDLDDVDCEGLDCEIRPTELSLLKWKRPIRDMSWWLPDNHPQPRLPINLEGAKRLAILELQNWEISNGFPDTLATLTNAHILSLRSLHGLNCLPRTFGNLPWLQRLELASLSLSTLPDSFGELSCLQHLRLCNLRIEMLPTSFGHLSSLQILQIESCPALRSLPASFGLLCGLEKLEFFECNALQQLPGTFGQLMTLKRLSITKAPVLEDLPQSFGSLTALTDLVLYKCPKLERLPPNFALE